MTKGKIDRYKDGERREKCCHEYHLRLQLTFRQIKIPYKEISHQAMTLFLQFTVPPSTPHPFPGPSPHDYIPLCFSAQSISITLCLSLTLSLCVCNTQTQYNSTYLPVYAVYIHGFLYYLPTCFSIAIIYLTHHHSLGLSLSP